LACHRLLNPLSLDTLLAGERLLLSLLARQRLLLESLLTRQRLLLESLLTRQRLLLESLLARQRLLLESLLLNALTGESPLLSALTGESLLSTLTSESWLLDALPGKSLSLNTLTSESRLLDALLAQVGSLIHHLVSVDGWFDHPLRKVALCMVHHRDDSLTVDDRLDFIDHVGYQCLFYKRRPLHYAAHVGGSRLLNVLLNMMYYVLIDLTVNDRLNLHNSVIADGFLDYCWVKDGGLMNVGIGTRLDALSSESLLLVDGLIGSRLVLVEMQLLADTGHVEVVQ